MLEFHVEWEESPGVRDRVLAATWARLEIRLGPEHPQRTWPSCLLSAPAGSLRTGIYGSVFPLAEWLVENWWTLLYETCPVPEFFGGRSLFARDPAQKAWLGRHDLLLAREGGSLPDLAIYRDGEHIAVRWAPDPDWDEQVRPVRFVTSGEIRLNRPAVADALRRLVNAVIDRLAEARDADSLRLIENWRAVCDSEANEAEVCRWAGSLGLDPYDPQELGDELVELLTARIPQLSSHLALDLLEASTSRTLRTDLDWLDQARSHVETVAATLERGEVHNGQPPLTTAHDAGYDQARRFRQAVDVPLGPIPDLPALLRQKANWAQEYELDLPPDPHSSLLAMVGTGAAGFPRIIGPPLTAEAQSFRLARALYFLTDDASSKGPRLVTKAFGWDQRASRAFAAELLAPADALRAEITGTASYETIARLADRFHVSPMVIEHQLRNHRIAWTTEL